MTSTTPLTPQEEEDREVFLWWCVGIGAAIAAHFALVLSATGIGPAALGRSLGVLIRLPFGRPMQDGVVLGPLWLFLLWFAVIGAGIIAACWGARWLVRRLFGLGDDNGLATIADFRGRTKPEPGELPFAKLQGKPIYDTPEDTGVVLAPTGMGKTTRVVVKLMKRIGAKPAVQTSTKPEVLRLTAGFRRNFGTIWVFDPERVSGWPTPCRWNIVAGCETDQVAMERAKAIVAARPLDGDSKNSGFFATAAQVIIRCLLHAAAVGRDQNGNQYTMRDVLAWTQDFSDDTPYTILRSHPDAIHSWHRDLMKYCRGEATETVSSTEQTLSGILEAFAIEAILDSVCPGEGVSFDPDAFHGSTDTIYLLSQSGSAPLAAPVITALVESIQHSAKVAATRTEAGKLVPELVNVLDEVANICPLPGLPSLMSEGRGFGIKTWGVGQNRAQFEQRFGRDGAATILNNAAVFLALGGSKDTGHLRELAELAGEREEQRFSTSYGDQHSSTSTSTHKESNLTISQLHHLPVGQAVLFYRELPPAIVELEAWFEGKDSSDYEASQEWVLIEEGFRNTVDASA